MPTSLPAALALAALLLAQAWLAGLRVDLPLALGLLAAGALIALCGRHLLAAIGAGNGGDAHGVAAPGVQAVTGMLFAALAVSGIVTVTDLTALAGFAVLAGGVAVASLATMARHSDLHSRQRADWADGLRLLVIAGSVLFWARRSIAPGSEVEGAVAVWSDYVLHAVEIAQYENGRAAGAMLLAGEPMIFYHRGAYALPAAFAQWLDATPLQAGTAALLPMGLFAALAAAAALADRIGGSALAGWAAAACAIALPDAAAVGLRNGFFGAHWLLFTSPGTGWAVAAGLLSLLLLDRWLAKADRRLLAAAVLACAASFWLRAHVFLLAAPTLVLMLASKVAMSHRVARHAAGVALGLFAMAAFAVVSIATLRAPWLAFSAVDEYLPLVHRTMAPSAYDGLWDTMVGALPLPAALLLGSLLVLPACLGLLMPAYAVLLALAARFAGLRAIDAAPIAMAASLLALTLAAPGTAHGDLSEYQHRGFPLLYMLTLATCAGLLTRTLAALRRRDGPGATSVPGASRLPAPAIHAISAFAMCAAVTLQGRSDPAANQMPWTTSYYPLRLDSRLGAAAAFLRRHASPGDRLVALPPEPEALLNDAAASLVALSAVPAWIGRVEVQRRTANAQRRRIVDDRATGLQQIGASTAIAALHTALDERGIRWLVLRSDTAPAWDPADDLAAFKAPGVRVYRGEGVHR